MPKFLSIASLWEIVIKVQLGKLSLGMEADTFFDDFVVSRELELLEISLDDVVTYGALPLHHRDPFDRTLVAQATTAALPLVTADVAFERYGVELVW